MIWTPASKGRASKEAGLRLPGHRAGERHLKHDVESGEADLRQRTYYCHNIDMQIGCLLFTIARLHSVRLCLNGMTFSACCQPLACICVVMQQIVKGAFCLQEAERCSEASALCRRLLMVCVPADVRDKSRR